MRRLGLGQVSRLFEPLARLEQVRGQIAAPNVDAETIDHTPSFDHGATRLPEGAPLARTQLGPTMSEEMKGARPGLSLAHTKQFRSCAREWASGQSLIRLRRSTRFPAARFRSRPDAPFHRRPRLGDVTVEEFRTGDPLFTVNGALTVLSWNGGAEQLTGVRASDAVGRRCWEVLGGLGEDGDVICHARCSHARLAWDGFPVRCHAMLVRTARGRERIDVSTVALADGRILHVLAGRRPTRAAVALTTRQREVLGLMANGLVAKVIAARLGVAETTVRTHIRTILRQLDAHSQLEAVAKARRTGLLSA
jgi:DNA-binding CsgD family transcriptional regulator